MAASLKGHSHLLKLLLDNRADVKTHNKIPHWEYKGPFLSNVSVMFPVRAQTDSIRWSDASILTRVTLLFRLRVE